MKKKTVLWILVILCLPFAVYFIFGYTPIPSLLGYKWSCITNGNAPPAYYEKEPSDILKHLSVNEMTEIIEYIRDSIYDLEHPGEKNTPAIAAESKKYPAYYFGYRSTLPGVNYEKSWKIFPEPVIEVPYGEYLNKKSNMSFSDPDNTPYFYSMNFFSGYDTLLCVTVEHDFFSIYGNIRRIKNIEIWSFSKNIFGKWEFNKRGGGAIHFYDY
jgi:hypothetical protein